MARKISSYRPPLMGTTHMVSANNYHAAIAGYKILEEGGNAVDAGVATGIAINVTQPHHTGFGGVAPIILYNANQEQVLTISGLGTWPRAASIEFFKEKYAGDLPAGILRSVVPAAADAWLTALERFGTMTFTQVVAPSIRLSEEGFPTEEQLHTGLKEDAPLFSQWPSSCQAFMPRGYIPHVGEIFQRPELANTFKQLVEVEKANGYRGREAAIRAVRDYFYKGDIARKIVGFCQEQGGLLTREDMENFSVKIEPPEKGQYKQYTIYTCGFWCQGPMVIQTLQMLEDYDFRALGHNSADYIHLVVEALKLAFSDRHSYYGDPAMVEVPAKGLMSREYARVRRNLIDPARAWPEMPPPGDPWSFSKTSETRRSGSLHESKTSSKSPQTDTSYLCVVDRWGNAFSATPSDTVLHSPIIPGLGFSISARGFQSWLDPAHPSCVAPGKRPRLTPNPAIIFREGKLWMPFGTPGLDVQTQSMTQMFLNIVEFGFNPQQAVEEPRFFTFSFPQTSWPHPYHPGRLCLEGRISQEIASDLAGRGHKVEMWDDWGPAGALCGIIVDHEKGILIAGADPRRDCYAVGR